MPEDARLESAFSLALRRPFWRDFGQHPSRPLGFVQGEQPVELRAGELLQLPAQPLNSGRVKPRILAALVAQPGLEVGEQAVRLVLGRARPRIGTERLPE